jgi:uncharacterized membrane protein YkvA (DUF1232 family)
MGYSHLIFSIKFDRMMSSYSIGNSMSKKFLTQAFSQWFFNGYRTLIRNPKYFWLVILGSVLYLADPVDILPDVIPGIGWLDDGLVATFLVTEITQVFLDRLKASKNQQQFVNSNTSQAPESNTVDVEAVVVD